jgi:hypothetical protein
MINSSGKEFDAMKRTPLLLAAAFACLLAPSRADAELLYGFGAGQLETFDTATLNVTNSVAITGLLPGDFIAGIDIRPATGQLYGLAVTLPLGNFGRLYTIDPATGVATLASTLSTTVPFNFLLGFGIDFDPVADRLRIVARSGPPSNFRVDVDNGDTVGSGGLSSVRFAPGDPNFGELPEIFALAHTNNFAGTASTTLYGIGIPPAPIRPAFVTFDPADPEVVHTVGQIPLFNAFTAFDISGATGTAYAVSGSDLYTVDLATASATLVGTIPFYIGVAAPVGAPAAIPEPASLALAVTGVVGLLGFALRRQRPSAGGTTPRRGSANISRKLSVNSCSRTRSGATRNSGRSSPAESRSSRRRGEHYCWPDATAMATLAAR